MPKRKPRLAYLEFKFLPVTPKDDERVVYPQAALLVADGLSMGVIRRFVEVRKRVVRGMRQKAREVN